MLKKSTPQGRRLHITNSDEALKVTLTCIDLYFQALEYWKVQCMQWAAMTVGRICQQLSVGIHRQRCGAMWHQCQPREALLVLQYLETSECVLFVF